MLIYCLFNNEIYINWCFVAVIKYILQSSIASSSLFSEVLSRLLHPPVYCRRCWVVYCILPLIVGGVESSTSSSRLFPEVLSRLLHPPAYFRMCWVGVELSRCWAYLLHLPAFRMCWVVYCILPLIFGGVTSFIASSCLLSKVLIRLLHPPAYCRRCCVVYCILLLIVEGVD